MIRGFSVPAVQSIPNPIKMTLRFGLLRAVSGQLAIDIVGSADERDMRKGLGVVTQVLPAGAEFLGEKPQVVGVSQGLLEEVARLFRIAGTSQAFHVPEGTHGESSLRSRQPVEGLMIEFVTEDERIAHKVGFDGLQRR